MAVIVRPETTGDRQAIFAVNAAAFETSSEADLVEALRASEQPTVSLVAELDGRIVGHILFSPVIAQADDSVRIMGLGPMAVTPEHQGEGIGSALVRTGLAACRALGVSAVVVLGHPGYYPRFGFERASRFGIRCEYDVPDDAFMALELVAGGLGGIRGRVRYHEAFDQAS
jgi:putative acetyltransferase